jgi:Domain of unknown function (DUF1963)
MITDTTFFSHADRINELKQAIHENFSPQGADAIQKLIRENLQVALLGFNDNIRIGSTKFGGPSDSLPSGVEFLGDDDQNSDTNFNRLYRIEDKSFYFLAQLDLKQIQGLIPNEFLPKEGLLSFFVEHTEYDPLTRVFFEKHPHFVEATSVGIQVDLVKGLSLPSYSMLEKTRPDLTSGDNPIIAWDNFRDFDRYCLSKKPCLYDAGWNTFSILGYPKPLQTDYFTFEETLLLQVYEGNLRKNSDLNIYFTIDNIDLDRQAFDMAHVHNDTT